MKANFCLHRNKDATKTNNFLFYYYYITKTAFVIRCLIKPCDRLKIPDATSKKIKKLKSRKNMAKK